MTEQEFVEHRLEKLKEARDKIPDTFRKFQDQCEGEIQTLIRQAGIADQIEVIRGKVETLRKKLQKDADIIAGQMAALTELREKFHLAPIPDGVTHMHGIELAPLEWQTRLRVMQGDEETILILGGTLTQPPTDSKRTRSKHPR